jgi:hypothetical protein
VIRRLWADNMFRGGTLIFWEVDTRCTDIGPWTFMVEWGRSVNGPWTAVSTPPVQDTYFTIDPFAHLYAKQIDLYYRVTMTTGAGRTFTSYAARADGGMPRRDWLIAKELTRKEYLNMMKSPAGMKGCLLKRRAWGDRCLASTDHDTAEVVTSRCMACFDVGIVGGYYPAVEFWVLNPDAMKSQRIQRDEQRGMVGDIITKVRALPYPHVESNDVWVSADDDRRWYVNAVSVKVEVRTKPIVLELELRLAPASDLIYDFPLEACGTGGSWSGPTDACAQQPSGDGEQVPEFCVPPVPDV